MEKEVNFEVLVYGRPARQYNHDGFTYVEGRDGSEFTLRVSNNTGRRVLAVVTVDGLSVMNGRDGSYNSGGYVLGPHSSVDIPGWRLNNDKVAGFFFTANHMAYASLMGKPTNVGVIGCAVFREKELSIPIIWEKGRNDAKCDLYEYNPSLTYRKGSGNNIGSGFGKETEHRVSEVEFKREPNPFVVFKIYYDDRKGLKDRGIDFGERHITKPDPFPVVQGCPPPLNWKGQK